MLFCIIRLYVQHQTEHPLHPLRISRPLTAESIKYIDNGGVWREEICCVGIVLWHKLAESCYENPAKGSAILVEDELQSKNWKLDTGINRADSISQ